MPNLDSGGAGVHLHGISQAAFDMIVEFEVTSEAAYNKLYRRPTRPGGQSGITIGIGYDCGYSTAVQIRSDWGGLLPTAMVDALASVAGLTGARADRVLQSVRNRVDVPWAAALAVFSNTSLPKYLALADNLPNWDKLSPDCKGALVSLVYNRGASFSLDGDRYREMRAIKSCMASGRFSDVPSQMRSMKRIWAGKDDMRGLLIRRDKEADLFELGLKAPLVAAAPQPPPSPKPSTVSEQQPPSWGGFFMSIAKLFKRA